ncbi:MAG: ATP-binding cassette domain-containing protein [Bacteroidales bacterium]|nr:ATP-binding cassette domain-containing protein [Bacteroidales bacterium]
MLTINNLTVSYEKNNPILKNLNYRFDKNGIYGLLGKNGSGKTTFFNTLYKILKPKEGSINFLDKKLKRSDIAYLQSEARFFYNITGNEYLSLFADSGFDLQPIIKKFSIPLNNLIDEYSLGMKKKLSILASLKQNRPIFIADEPFDNIDLESYNLLKKILLEIAKNKIVIVSSHIIESLTSVCDKILLLKDGTINKEILPEEYNNLEKIIFEFEN